MKRTVVTALAAGLFGVLAVVPADAGYRGAGAPPLLLSPDLTEPWVLQLQPSRRGVRQQVTTRPAPRLQARPSRQAAGAARALPPIDPRFLPTVVAYDGPHKPGTVIIDTNERYLYLVEGNGFARRYGVGVGRPGFEWAGTHKVTRKAEWPDWRPPAEMRARAAKTGQTLPVVMAGGPNNPLGARALYLGSTLYRIHGSNEPWTIGKAVSSGCIRMRNEDVTDLYERVPVGAKVIVI
ncbi:L,D-transpeptidase [Stappia sp. F7233]|uniref:L,D-transpeptidase n=1 Tax=Stappia albiluteola TaxID=2758565 RepID=A0A839AJB3_9HYPH|nr:L,D-transpeptidase [Stappia albiluteola]MBA5779235.1 L,D-transpeptidase [Stappia albiluteola]